MEFEHCEKCGKQLEVLNKKPSHYNSNRKIFKENNELSFNRTEKTATVFTFHYCDECYWKIQNLLAERGFIPHGKVY